MRNHNTHGGDKMEPSGDSIPGKAVVKYIFSPSMTHPLFVVLPCLGSEDYMFKTTSQPQYKFCMCEASSS